MGPDLLMAKYGFSPAAALNVTTKVHTPPAACGLVFNEIKPRMAVAHHFFNDFDTRYPIYEGLRRTYKGPVTMATDLLVWNVTKKDIRVRQVIVDADAWPAKSPTSPDDPDPKLKTPFSAFVDNGRMDTNKELGPLINKFKKQHNLK